MSFLDMYLDFTRGQEATERVHKWVGLSTIAGALERKVWINRGSYTLYPNLYTFIIGPSGVVRKSTSTAIGVDLLREIDTIKVMSERLTAASLIQQFSRSAKTFPYNGRMVKQSACFAYASELNVFLGEVFGSISELLTTFYDCVPANSEKPWKYETIANGVTNIYGPCLNLLGASTPAWLNRSIPASELEGGFASRVIFVVEDVARRAIAFPELEIVADDYESRRRALATDLRRIHALTGSMKSTEGFYREGKLWYESHQKSQRTNTDLRFSGYFGRKFDTVLKVATLLSVSASDNLILDTPHFQESLALLQDVESRMFNAFGAHGDNPNSSLMEKVWLLLCNEKRMTTSRLLTLVRRDATAERLSAIVDHLMMMQRVGKIRDHDVKDVVLVAINPEKPL